MDLEATPRLEILRRTARRLLDRAVDLVYPPQCLACRVPVDTQGTLCPDCWAALSFVTPPRCALCGLPFEYDVGSDALCGACLAREPAYDRGRAALVYDDASRPLILGFKHGDRLHGAARYARFMLTAGADLVADADAILPVPLHWWRQWRRRYNQSALLAIALGRLAGRPVLTTGLVRHRATPPQGRLTRENRLRNVRGAFRVTPALADRIAGRRLLLVDDVLTTGATAEACARTLKRAGAAAVDVLVLARVVRVSDQG